MGGGESILQDQGDAIVTGYRYIAHLYCFAVQAGFCID